MMRTPPRSLREALDRGTNKETVLEATHGDEREVKKDRDKLTHASLASHQQLPFDHGVAQSPTHPEPAQTQAAELEIESPEIELGGTLLL